MRKDDQYWIVKKVTPEENYFIVLDFADGSRKRYDVKPIMSRFQAFERLKDPDYFKRVHTDGITAVWDDVLDIAPEELYEKGVLVA